MGHEYSLADIAAANGNGMNNEMWNNPFIYLVWLAVLGRGGLFGGGYGAGDPAVQGALTRSDLFEGFNNQDVNGQLRGITNGICDGFYAVNSSLKDGFYGIQGAVKDCCCTTNRNVDSVKYEMSKGFCDVITANNLNTRDILESQNAGVQKILDYLCASEKQALRDRIQTLETSGIIQAQTQNLVSTLRPCPIPAYLTCSPYASYNFGCGTTGGLAYGA